MLEPVDRPMFTMAATIGTREPWVVAAASGAVRMMPVRMLSTAERQGVTEDSVVLRLTDLGHLGGVASGDVGADRSPFRVRTEIVLLLPTSHISTIASLDVLARSSQYEYSPHFAPEDWLTTWHHFVDSDDRDPLGDEMGECARRLSYLPSSVRRQYVFGVLAGEDVDTGALGADPLTNSWELAGSAGSVR